MKYCGNCGKELNDEDKFCSNCSTEFLEFSFEAENTKKQNSFNVNKSKKKGIAIIISVVAIIVIATIGITVATQYDDLKASYNEAVDDSRWAKLSDTSVGYGYKETPEKFVDSIKKFFTNLCLESEEFDDALDYFNSLTYLDKIKNDNFDEYIYTYSESNGNQGYYIDYDGKYISEAKAVVSSNVVNDNPARAKEDLCMGVVSILYAYGANLEDEDFWKLQSRIGLEISNKMNNFPNSQSFCRYDNFIISFYSDEQYIVTMSYLKLMMKI